jgi:cellobiose phosphorylase
VLADIGDKALLEGVMDRVEKELKCKYGYVQCYPSFTKGDDKIGRVSYFRKGLVENGAVYNHGVAFKIVADCKLGRGDNAYKSFKLISCDNPDNANSGVEPYAVSNMYIGPENEYSAGFAPMSWITGTAGWLYRCVSEFICGVKPTFEGLKIQPCMPKGWDGVKVVRKFRGETYDVTYQRTGRNRVICDGKEVDILPLSGKGSVHKVVCEY